MTSFQIKKFEDLTNAELYSIIQLREKVFVVEQECVYLDADGKDEKSWHLLFYNDETICAYLRILPANISFKTPSIGRVVVDENYRNKGYGVEIMKIAIDFLNKKFNAGITIGAQVYLNKFYQDLGFKNIGEEYLEDGIPHIDMFRE